VGDKDCDMKRLGSCHDLFLPSSNVAKCTAKIIPSDITDGEGNSDYLKSVHLKK
jgi:hypothetical protein